MPQALIIVDVQNDFLPGGALAVPDGDAVLAPIAALAADERFDIIVATRDWHPADHFSFDAQGGPWPVHCVQGTRGAELADAVPRERIDAVIDTGVGTEDPGYSPFEEDELRLLLREEQVVAVTIVGLATDVCVLHTAQDALKEGLLVTVKTDGIRGIDAQDSRRALDELAAGGAQIS